MLTRVDWNDILENARFRGLDESDRAALAGAGPNARLAEWDGLVIVSDRVEFGVPGNPLKRRVFQALNESGEMVDQLVLPAHVL
jgi:hypothetical protein